MHNKDAQGNDHFLCDFCHSPWSEDRPMVEGHRGSLICARCLTLAFRAIVHEPVAADCEQGECALCLQYREEPTWPSPLDETIRACYRCVTQSARVLEKDPDFAWQAPER
ncbi:MAG: ClpX C4-type zinc finger protein [Phycisphaerales bacterium JB039]